METININKEVKKPRQKVLDPIKLEEQEVYMDKVRVLNEKWAKKKRRKPTVGLGTFGCQMNYLNTIQEEYYGKKDVEAV